MIIKETRRELVLLHALACLEAGDSFEVSWVEGRHFSGTGDVGSYVTFNTEGGWTDAAGYSAAYRSHRHDCGDTEMEWVEYYLPADREFTVYTGESMSPPGSGR